MILSRLFSSECRSSTGGCQFLVQREMHIAIKSRDGRGSFEQSEVGWIFLLGGLVCCTAVKIRGNQRQTRDFALLFQCRLALSAITMRFLNLEAVPCGQDSVRSTSAAYGSSFWRLLRLPRQLSSARLDILSRCASGRSCCWRFSRTCPRAAIYTITLRAPFTPRIGWILPPRIIFASTARLPD